MRVAHVQLLTFFSEWLSELLTSELLTSPSELLRRELFTFHAAQRVGFRRCLSWKQSSPVSLGAQDAIIVAEALALVCVGVSIGHILAGRDVVWFS